MKVDIIKISGWEDAFYVMRSTQDGSIVYDGKMPSELTKKKILISGHSPAHLVRILVRFEIPNKTQNHFVRHKFVEWFVSTLRGDIVASRDEEVTRLTPRVVVAEFNLVSLVDFLRKRLCMKAEKETVEAADMLARELEKVDPELFKGFYFAPDCSSCREVFMDCHGHKTTEEDIINSFYNSGRRF